MNILFTNVGRRTYLLKYALEIAAINPELHLFVSDTSNLTAAFHVDPRIHTLITPFVSSDPEHYLKTLLDLCAKNKIDLVLPLMDFELPILSEHVDSFLQRGTKIIVSNPELVEACLDKQKTYVFCKENNIPSPKILSATYIKRFPVIVKRKLGSGSVGLCVANTQEGLLNNYDEAVDIVQEYVSGQEYGMDILNDLNGNYIHSCTKKKIGMRAGETDKAESFFSEKYETWAREISSATKHIGNMDVDFIETESGEIFFIDFNPRFGGGYPFTHISGFNYLAAIIKMVSGDKVSFDEVIPNYCIGLKGIEVFYGHR